MELLIHWKFSVEVRKEEVAKKKAYDQSAIGKLERLGNQFKQLVGADDSECEPESDVSLRLFIIVHLLVCKCF